MAAKQTAGEQKLYPIETLKEKTGTKEALHRGVCAANGWTAGKMLTEAAYSQAIEAYKKKPIGRV